MPFGQSGSGAFHVRAVEGFGIKNSWGRSAPDGPIMSPASNAIGKRSRLNGEVFNLMRDENSTHGKSHDRGSCSTQTR